MRWETTRGSRDGLRSWVGPEGWTWEGAIPAEADMGCSLGSSAWLRSRNCANRCQTASGQDVPLFALVKGGALADAQAWDKSKLRWDHFTELVSRIFRKVLLCDFSGICLVFRAWRLCAVLVVGLVCCLKKVRPTLLHPPDP